MCRHDYLPLFRSRQVACSRHDPRHGPKSGRKRILTSILIHFPCPLLEVLHLAGFCISQGFASHRVVCITFSNPARATAHSPKTRSRTGPIIHELVKTKTEISFTPHPNKTNFFVVVRTAHISSLVEQSKITACDHAQLTRLFTKH